MVFPPLLPVATARDAATLERERGREGRCKSVRVGVDSLFRKL